MNEKQITAERGANAGLIYKSGNHLKLVFLPSVRREQEVIELNDLITRYLKEKGYSIGARQSGSSIHGARLNRRVLK